MNDSNILDIPKIHPIIEKKSEEIGFLMPSAVYIGTLLKTLKVKANPAIKAFNIKIANV